MVQSGSPASQKLINALMRFRKLQHHHQSVGGLRQSEVWLLMTLQKARERDEQGLRVSQLARTLNIATPTATQMVMRLADTGYLERRRSTKDRRVVHVALTSQGVAFIESIQKHFVSRFDAAVRFLGEKDSNHLADLLDRITDFLAGYDNESSTKERGA